MDTSKHSREALRHPERRPLTAPRRPAQPAAARRDSSLNSTTGRGLPPRVPLADWMSFAAFALSLPASGSSHRKFGPGRPPHRPATDALMDGGCVSQRGTSRNTCMRNGRSRACGTHKRALQPSPELTHSLTHQLINCFLAPKALLRAQGQPAVPTIPALRTPQRLRATIVLPTSYVADLGRAPTIRISTTIKPQPY